MTPQKTTFVHYSFNDPANAKGSYEEKILVYRKVRDQINDFLIKELPTIINNKI